MEFNRITQKTETEAVKPEAHVLVTQPETVDGASVEALRRATLDSFVEASLQAIGLAVVDGRLCAIIEHDK
jgi:hypothetical protein